MAALTDESGWTVPRPQTILHVGLHKTATSSFQATCGKNHEALADQGFIYPGFQIDDQRIFNHSIPIYSLFCEDPESYNFHQRSGTAHDTQRLNAAYRQQLEAALCTKSTLILSGESISILPVHRLQALKDYLLSRGRDLRVLCGVRRPYSFLCSEIQQRIRSGIGRRIAGAKVHGASARVSALKNVFPDTEFFSFEQDCSHTGGPVTALLERIGVNAVGFDLLAANEGLGNITTRLYAAINQKYPVIWKKKLNPRGRNERVVNLDNEKFLLFAEELDHYRSSLSTENAVFSDLLGSEFCDRDMPLAKEFEISRELALRILSECVDPPHVRDAVLEFLVAHADGTFDVAELGAMT